MIEYPYLKEQPSFRQTVDVFKGYNHNLRIGPGEFYEMENMTSEDYPVLSTRAKRAILKPSVHGCRGMYYVPGTGLFYATIVDSETWLYLLKADGAAVYVTQVGDSNKKFALMGDTLVIAPDMKAVNIRSLQAYSLDEVWTVSNGSVKVSYCDADGDDYEIHPANVRTTSIGSPTDGLLWLDISGTPTLKQYDLGTQQWVTIENVCLKITGLGEHNFYPGDGVEISGFYSSEDTRSDSLNGSFAVEYAGHGCIVINSTYAGSQYTQDCAATPITIRRTAPRLDFIVESGNRLWGCAEDTNEIYACKLGDHKNWNCFQGLSTDSWVGSVGTPGEFTGAVVQNGYPVFYKENCKHKVWPSATGAHQITVVDCFGVEKNSGDSLAVLDGTVFYKSSCGICADDGGGVTIIGQNLGDVYYSHAHGAVFRRKYYLVMLDRRYKAHLFVYDIEKRMWHVEDGPSARFLAAGNGSLYSISNDTLLDLTGNTGTQEGPVSWMVQTGDLGLELPEQKYISRLTLRVSLEPGATLEAYAQYDRGPVWVKLGQVYGTELRSFSLPLRPRRCDQLRLKLQGTGMCRVYSITKTLEKGSELS